MMGERTNQERYDRVLADIDAGVRQVDRTTIKRDVDASGGGMDLILEATGASTFDEAVGLAVGRPRLGTGRGASPVVRARVPQAVKDGLGRLAQQQQRPESELVREAVAVYLAAHRERPGA